MDFFIFCILGAICSTAAQALAEKTIAQAIVSSVAGGAIEEVVEYLVKKISPDGHFFFTTKHNSDKRLYIEVHDYFKNLSADDQQKLMEFMNKLDYRKVSPQYAKLMELVRGDVSDALKKMQNINEPENKKFKKETQKLIHDLYTDLENNITEKLEYKSLNNIIKDLFNTKWEKMPKVAKDLFITINDQIYELKYFKMSTEDRDLVKVIQKMIDDGNERLLTRLQTSFQYIAQRCNEADAAYKTISFEEMEMINPFCYFRLECPHCGASGASVRKDSDNNVYCSSCGKTHSIVQAVRDDKVAELIGKKFDEVQMSFASVINEKNAQLEENLKKELGKELDHLAGKILDSSYFEEFKNSLTQQGNDREARIIKTLERIVTDSEGKIAERVAKEIADIKAKDGDKLLQEVKTRIETLNKQNRKLLLEICEIVKQTRNDVVQMKNMISMMLPLTINLSNDTVEIKKMLQSFMDIVTPINFTSAKQRLTCPYCGHLTEFEKQGDNNFYSCSICGCKIHKDSLQPNIIPPCTAPQFEFKQRGENCLLNYKDGSCKASGNTEVVLIHLTCESVNMLNDTNIDIGAQDGSGIHPTKIILRGNVNINVSNLKRIYNNLFRNAQMIVLGKDLTLNAQGNPNLIIGASILSNPWKYEENLHRLMQT